jgi:hypothetical protein
MVQVAKFCDVRESRVLRGLHLSKGLVQGMQGLLRR